jgi:hypothetical protein
MGLGFSISKTLSVSIVRGHMAKNEGGFSKTSQQHHPDIRFMIETVKGSLLPFFVVLVKREPNNSVVVHDL